MTMWWRGKSKRNIQRKQRKNGIINEINEENVCNVEKSKPNEQHNRTQLNKCINSNYV